MKRFPDIFSRLRRATNESNSKSVQYCIGELLNVFEDSAQCERTINLLSVGAIVSISIYPFQCMAT